MSASATKTPRTDMHTVAAAESKSSPAVEPEELSISEGQARATTEPVPELTKDKTMDEKRCTNICEENQEKESEQAPTENTADAQVVNSVEDNERGMSKGALAESPVQPEASHGQQLESTPSGVRKCEAKELSKQDAAPDDPVENVSSVNYAERVDNEIEPNESHVEMEEGVDENEGDSTKPVVGRKAKNETMICDDDASTKAARAKLTRLTVRQLKSRLKRARQDTNGTKPTLIQRMIDAGLHITNSKQATETSPNTTPELKARPRRSTRKRQRIESEGAEFITSAKKKRVSALQSGVSARKTRRKGSNEEVRIVLTSHRLSALQEKKLGVFNAKLTDDVADCTHLVVKKGSITRTLKLLYAMSKPDGPHIVHDGWINESVKLHHKAEVRCSVYASQAMKEEC